MRNKILFILFLSFANPNRQTIAQITQSPYSRIGLGDMLNSSSCRNFSMGGIGIGTPGLVTINPLNPASFGDIRLTTLDVSGFGEWRTQKENNVSNSMVNSAVDNFGFAFRTNKPLTIVTGLTPLSSVGYSILVPDTVSLDTSNQPYTTHYDGRGGLNQFYLGFGFSCFRKLRFGANLPVTFGSIHYTWKTSFEDVNVSPVTIVEKSSMFGISPAFGVQYEDSLKFDRKVDELEESADRMKKIEDEIADLKRDEADKKKDEEELGKMRSEFEANMKENEDRRKEIAGQRVNMEETGSGSEKEIEKLRRKEFHFAGLNKSLEQKLRKEEKELRVSQQTVERRQKQLSDESAKIAEKVNRIESTGNDSIRYRQEKQTILFCAGAVLSLPSNLSADRSIDYKVSNFTDTVVFENNGTVTLPWKTGGGISIGQTRKWMIGADFTMQDWSQAQFFGTGDSSLQSSFKVALGGEWIPGYFSRKLAEKISWRTGLYYQKTPYILANASISEVGFTFGMGIPLGFRPERKTLLFSNLNLGLSFGKRGTLESNLLKENFMQIRIGMNLNDRWFIKRPVD